MLNTRPRIIVYTAIIGQYDSLKRVPSVNRANAAYQCFTDAVLPKSGGWDLTLLRTREKSVDERIRCARFIKTHPHTLLGEHNVSIWIDANLALVVDPLELAGLVEDRPFATFNYPDTYGPRDCLYQEAQACCARGKDDPHVIAAQMQRYRKIGYPPHNGLAETSIVVRRNTPLVSQINATWWEEISHGSRRDQLSFNYAMWKHGADYRAIPGSRRLSPVSTFHPHLVSIYPD